MNKSKNTPRVLLVSPPWRTPDESNLAVGTLRPILEGEGFDVDELHCTHLFPPTGADPILLLQYSAFFFIPHLYPDIDRGHVVDMLIDLVRDEVNLHGSLSPPELARLEDHDLDPSKMRADTFEAFELAGVCLERSFERLLQADYAVYGFSCTFETQIPAALYLARRLKRARPEVRVALGGAACFGDPASELMRIYPFLDVVCHCEGDQVIVPLFRALVDGSSLAEVPGIVYRTSSDGGSGEPVATASPELLTDLDSLPLPTYDDYLAQHRDSHYGAHEPKIYFETSRGCWWGQKHLCTFCGLNAEGLTFRKKSPERAYEEIAYLYQRYPGRLHATDNILDMGYFDTVLPRLAKMRRNPLNPLRIFVETKSNLRLRQVQALADAGVDLVQPGIEAFSDGILRVMKKGATGLIQVQVVKWLHQHGVNIAYNLLIRNPGESAEDYREMLDILDAIDHLQPPHINAMWLERFSPYYIDPERHGIKNVRPKPYYDLLYREPGADLSRLAFVFDYDFDGFEDPEMLKAHRAYAQRVVRWQIDWVPNRLHWHPIASNQIIVLDQRGPSPKTALLGGAEAALFTFLDAVHSRKAVARHFPELDPDLIDGLLETWIHRRWIVRDRRDRLLCVVPRRASAASAKMTLPHTLSSPTTPPLEVAKSA